MNTLVISKKNGRKTRLPSNFSPSKFAVLCGRGSKCTKSPGNWRLKQLVKSYLKPYSEAKNKVEKTSIVSAIISCVKQACREGAFIKYEEGAWWEVEDGFAREKIGCMFRDCLHAQYRSSTKAKLARKKASANSSSVCDEGSMMVVGSQQVTSRTESMDATLEKGVAFSAMQGHVNVSSVRGNSDTTLSMSDIFGDNFDHHAFNTSFNSVGADFGQNQILPQKAFPTMSMDQGSSDNMFPSKSNKFEGYNALVGGYMGGQKGRQHREDFIRDCMPVANNFMDSSDAVQQQNMNTSMAMGMQCQSQTSSLLRVARDIVGGDNQTMNGCNAIMNEDDFPDDLSDIFDEEDTTEDPHSFVQSCFAV